VRGILKGAAKAANAPRYDTCRARTRIGTPHDGGGWSLMHTHMHALCAVRRHERSWGGSRSRRPRTRRWSRPELIGSAPPLMWLESSTTSARQARCGNRYPPPPNRGATTQATCTAGACARSSSQTRTHSRCERPVSLARFAVCYQQEGCGPGTCPPPFEVWAVFSRVPPAPCCLPAGRRATGYRQKYAQRHCALCHVRECTRGRLAHRPFLRRRCELFPVVLRRLSNVLGPGISVGTCGGGGPCGRGSAWCVRSGVGRVRCVCVQGGHLCLRPCLCVTLDICKGFRV
jgi:hypothetical protein